MDITQSQSQLGVDILYFLSAFIFITKLTMHQGSIYKQNIISLQFKKFVILLGPIFPSFFDSISKKFKVKHLILLE